MTAPPHPDVPPWRSRLAAAVGGLTLLLLLLSILDRGDPWTLLGGGVSFAAMMLIDGSFRRWWRKEPRRG
jgi:hypothetical protein